MDPENQEVWDLLLLGKRQWETAGMAGVPFRLDFQVIIRMAEALEIEIDELFIRKIAAYERTVLDIWAAQRSRDKCDAGQQARCRHDYGDFLEWACERCEKKSKARPDSGDDDQ